MLRPTVYSIEHDSSGDPKAEVKRKLVTKILWLVNRFSEESDHPYKKFVEDELLLLPLPNLQMIEEQAMAFKTWEKNNPSTLDMEDVEITE
jgi:hypothetical protein